MKIIELAKNAKVLGGLAFACLVGLAAIGYQFDRPAFSSEVKPVLAMAEYNQQMIMQMQYDQLTRSIWKQEDRLKMNPNDDGLQRLRELEEQRKRIEEKKKRLLEEEKG